jgi:hypothetical protein
MMHFTEWLLVLDPLDVLLDLMASIMVLLNFANEIFFLDAGLQSWFCWKSIGNIQSLESDSGGAL